MGVKLTSKESVELDEQLEVWVVTLGGLAVALLQVVAIQINTLFASDCKHVYSNPPSKSPLISLSKSVSGAEYKDASLPDAARRAALCSKHKLQ